MEEPVTVIVLYKDQIFKGTYKDCSIASSKKVTVGDLIEKDSEKTIMILSGKIK